MSAEVRVSGVKKPYNIHIGSGIIKDIPIFLKECTKAKKIVIITDDNVDSFYGDKVKRILEKADYDVLKFVFKHGEENKSLETVGNILEFMADNNVTRADCIVALGGGITGDISGYAAASFLRGIDFVQVPTTFLAAIDSSVGGKTGVNLKAGKNLAGAFYQPRCVICDIETFKTLPEVNFKEGVAEAIKYGIICDKELFDTLSTGKEWDLEKVIEKCVSIKAEIVSEDEFDTGKRQLLNFGHTIGHAIEKCSNFKITHGIAVGIGMAMISNAADALGWSLEPTNPQIVEALKNNGLLCETDIKKSDLLDAMEKDKKRLGQSINLVIPKTIGECVLRKIPVCDLKDVINNC